MTKGGKTREKSPDIAKEKTSKKASLKVKVFKTPKTIKAAKKTKVKKDNTKIKKPKTKKNSKASLLKSTKKTVTEKKTTHKQKQTDEKEKTEKIEPRILYERVEREKLFIIRAGATFVMAVIVIVWIFSMKQSLRVADNTVPERLSIESLKEITDTVTGRIEQLNNDLNKVQSFDAVINQALSSTTPEAQPHRSPFEEASSSIPLLIEKLNQKESATSSKTADIADIEELKKRIKELEDKLAE